LPRQRPADAPPRAAAKTQDVSKSNIPTPLPRSRPAERRVEVAAPAAIAPVKKSLAETSAVESAVTTLPPETPIQETPPFKEMVPVAEANPAPQETGVQETARIVETQPVKVPATRFKPEVVIKRARAEAAAIEAAEAEEAAARHADKAKDEENAAAQLPGDPGAAPPGNPDQDKEFSNAQLAAPKQTEQKQAEKDRAESEPAAPPPSANDDLPEQPAMQKRAGPPKVSSGAVPVSPSEAARLDRLEAQRKETGASSQRADGPATMATITP
jgi:hypothetical protein